MADQTNEEVAAAVAGVEAQEMPQPKKKLTKAEKAALKLQKKEEKRQKALEASRQEIRDHLKRELQFGNITYQRAFKSWQKMCKDIKVKELQEDLAGLWQRLNYIYDRKNFHLKLLQEELVEAEQTHQTCFSKHLDILDFLMRSYDYALKLMKENYEKVAERMILEFYAESDEINAIQDDRKSFTENFVHLTNIALKHNLNEAKINFEYDMRDAVDTNIEQQYLLKDDGTRKMTEMYNQLLQIFASLQQDALDPKRKTRYTQLVEKNLVTKRDLKKMSESTKKGQDVIIELQKKLVNVENKYLYKLTTLRNEKTFLIEHYWSLRKQYKNLMKDSDEDLSISGEESYNAIKELERQKRYGELLLGLAQCCRKLQTEKEKVLPWPKDMDFEKLEKTLEDADDETARMIIMQLFWYRVSRAKAHVLCLEEEKRNLEQENARYCQKLKSGYEVETADQMIKSLMLEPSVTSIPYKTTCPRCRDFPL